MDQVQILVNLPVIAGWGSTEDEHNSAQWTLAVDDDGDGEFSDCVACYKAIQPGTHFFTTSSSSSVDELCVHVGCLFQPWIKEIGNV